MKERKEDRSEKNENRVKWKEIGKNMFMKARTFIERERKIMKENFRERKKRPWNW